jgi:hypothetical protein
VNVGSTQGDGGAIHPYSKGVRSIPATSQTVLICETREEDLAAWADGASVGLWGIDVGGAVTLNNAHDPPSPGVYSAAGAGPGDLLMTYGPSSFHPGVVIHSFGDGSTRGLVNEIDVASYSALITRRSDDNGSIDTSVFE